MAGQCQFGDNCAYSHGEKEMQRLRDKQAAAWAKSEQQPKASAESSSSRAAAPPKAATPKATATKSALSAAVLSGLATEGNGKRMRAHKGKSQQTPSKSVWPGFGRVAHRCVKALASMAAVVGNYSTGVGILPQNVSSKSPCVSACAPLDGEAWSLNPRGEGMCRLPAILEDWECEQAVCASACAPSLA